MSSTASAFASVPPSTARRPRVSLRTQAAMEAFAEGEADVLVATSVIEVGIDVPNATVMLIEAAERYGLSQLHQLRGRVGRGEHPSLCILFGDPKLPRLRAIARETDGFRLAEALFSMLGDVSGARVLDLYAGSGALGIEALSRGARSATFVERDPRAVAALR